MTREGSTRMRGLPRASFTAALAAPLLLLFAGCATDSQYREALGERDQELRELREERTALKRQVAGLQSQRDDLTLALNEANDEVGRLVEAAARPADRSTGLEDLQALGMGVSTRGGRPVITIPAGITFGSGQAELSKAGLDALKAVAGGLKREYPSGTYWIEGHTDNDPIKKSKFKTNRDLSLARSMAVLRYLVETAHVPDERCVVVGWGEYRGLTGNRSDAEKARNRRVEILVE